MVAHTDPSARFVITVWRDGEVHDSQIARDGGRALQLAVIMLCALEGGLQGGDKLDVVEVPGQDLPEVSRAGHYS